MGRGWEAGVAPHLQCSVGLCPPISLQLSERGAGPEADANQGEFSVRQRDSECVREVNVSKNQQVCSCSLQSRAQPAARS